MWASPSHHNQSRAALLLLVLPMTIPDLALGGAVRTGAAWADAAVPLPLRPITMPVLAAGALGGGACLPVWPTTKLSSSGTAGRTAASAPTTILQTYRCWEQESGLCITFLVPEELAPQRRMLLPHVWK